MIGRKKENMIRTENDFFIFDREKRINFKYYLKQIYYNVMSLFYKTWMNINYPSSSNKKKYDVAAISIFKNEAQYLKEWIEYNHLIGIDHFFLYNNNSEDDYMSVLAPYIDSGLVTLMQWEKNQAQMECYNDGITRFRNESRWLCFIDIDEFIVPIKNNSIYTELRKFEKNRGSVVIYWKMFCSSGLMDRNRQTLVSESFTVCWNKLTDIGKCFYNTKYDFEYEYKRNNAFHHFLWTKYKGKYLPPVNLEDRVCFPGVNKIKNEKMSVQINHYFTKSYQEYLEKKSKGDVYFKINPHDEEYFYEHEMLSTSSDFNIFKYIIKLKLLND